MRMLLLVFREAINLISESNFRFQTKHHTSETAIFNHWKPNLINETRNTETNKNENELITRNITQTLILNLPWNETRTWGSYL